MEVSLVCRAGRSTPCGNQILSNPIPDIERDTESFDPISRFCVRRSKSPTDTRLFRFHTVRYDHPSGMCNR